MDVFIQQPEGVVAIDGRNVARMHEWQGVFRTFQPFATTLAMQLRVMAEHAYYDAQQSDEDYTLSDTLLQSSYDVQDHMSAVRVCYRALDVWRAGDITEAQLLSMWSVPRARGEVGSVQS